MIVTLLVIGEFLLEIVSGETSVPTTTPGGSPVNVAVGLSCLAEDVQFGDSPAPTQAPIDWRARSC